VRDVTPGRRIIDISIPVSAATPVWPGDTPFSCRWTWDMNDGSSVNVSTIGGSPHAGTHADTPLHVTRDGAASETLPLDVFRGTAIVLDVSTETGELSIDDIDTQLDAAGLGSAQIERLLLRTECGIADGLFPDAWPVLSTDCARVLVERGLRLLGVDAPSVDGRESTTLDIHHALLDHGACVLENLDLRAAPAGVYVLDALPLSVVGLDAAPVRAILLHGFE
jgi:arylformamidase